MDKEGLFLQWMLNRTSVDFESFSGWLESRLRKRASQHRSTSPVDIDDIVQESMLKLFASAPTRIESSRTYLWSVVNSAASEHFRRMGMEREASLRPTVLDVTDVCETQIPAKEDRELLRIEVRENLRPLARRITREDWRLCRQVINSSTFREACRRHGGGRKGLRRRWESLRQRALTHVA